MRLDLLSRVAGAPITWGVCEVPGWGHQLPPDRVLSEMAGIGLRATELGPEGFLPSDPGELRELVGRYGLELVGGFLPMALHLRDGLEERLAHGALYADLLARAGGGVLVLAASTGTTEADYEASPDLDRTEWSTLVEGIDRMAEIASRRGLSLAVHPHRGTVIERRDQVERFLETSGAGLCLDTGHLLIGGTDPVELTRMAGDRIEHVHLKDVSAEWADRVRGGRAGYADAVRGGLYRPLGAGDLDVSGIVRGLREAAYEGWVVLEQDAVLQTAPEEGAGPVHDASASLEFLRRCAWELEQGSPVTVAGRTRAARGATSRGEEEG